MIPESLLSSYTTARFMAVAHAVDQISRDDCSPTFYKMRSEVAVRLRTVSGLPEHRGNQEFLAWVALMVTLPLPRFGQDERFGGSESVRHDLCSPLFH